MKSRNLAAGNSSVMIEETRRTGRDFNACARDERGKLRHGEGLCDVIGEIARAYVKRTV